MRLIKSHVSCEWLLPGRQGGGRVRSVIVGVPETGPRQPTGSPVRICGCELLCFSWDFTIPSFLFILRHPDSTSSSSGLLGRTAEADPGLEGCLRWSNPALLGGAPFRFTSGAPSHHFVPPHKRNVLLLLRLQPTMTYKWMNLLLLFLYCGLKKNPAEFLIIFSKTEHYFQVTLQ